MSNGSHRTQHKPQRDEAKAKELSELKKENRVLRKALARSRKQILKLMEIHTDHDDSSEKLDPPKPSEKLCEACGGKSLVAIKVPAGILIVCKDCKHKKVEK